MLSPTGSAEVPRAEDCDREGSRPGTWPGVQLCGGAVWVPRARHKATAAPPPVHSTDDAARVTARDRAQPWDACPHSSDP